MTKKLLIIVTFLLSIGVSAHEGHDHNGPAGVQAPKGGIIKKLDDSYVEIVNRNQDLKIYFYDKDLKPIDAKTYTTAAKVQLPRVKKLDDLAFTAKDGSLEATYDAKKAHRYTLILSIKAPTEHHADTLKFTIEPKK